MSYRFVWNLKWFQKYPWGRRIKGRNLECLDLKANGKLIISDGLIDGHAIDTKPLPFKCWFLRTSPNSFIANASILWNIPCVHEYGIDHFTKERIVDDAMHTGALGVEPKYIGTAIVEAMEKDCFQTGETGITEKNLQVLRWRFKRHYKSMQIQDRSRRPCRIKFITHKMFDKTTLNCQAGEARDLVKFAMNLMREFSSQGSTFIQLAEAGTHDGQMQRCDFPSQRRTGQV